MILAKETNIDLDRILGYREYSVEEMERSGLWAALGDVRPMSVKLAVGVLLGVGSLAAAELGMLWPLAAMAVVSGMFVVLTQQADTSPTINRTMTERPGLSESQVWRYLGLHNEHEEFKSDRSEREARQRQMQAKSKAAASRQRGGR